MFGDWDVNVGEVFFKIGGCINGVEFFLGLFEGVVVYVGNEGCFLVV